MPGEADDEFPFDPFDDGDEVSSNVGSFSQAAMHVDYGQVWEYDQRVSLLTACEICEAGQYGTSVNISWAALTIHDVIKCRDICAAWFAACLSSVVAPGRSNIDR